MTPRSDEVIAAAAQLEAELIRDLRTLIAIPSVGGSAAEQRIQHWVADRLERLGLAVETWRTPMNALATRPGFPGAEVPRDALVGVLARLPGRSRSETLLLGHTDVVPAAGWSEAFEPRRVGDRIVGRGAVDMKAGVASLIHVVRVLRRTGTVPPRTLLVAPVSAEEDGGSGSFDLLPRLERLPEACLIAEPTGGDVVVANAGALGFRIVVHGRSAHAAWRWEGVDAMVAAAAVQQALARLEHELGAAPDPLLAQWPVPHPTVIGTIEGGEWASTVMPAATMRGRFGIPLSGDVAELRRRFEDVVAAAAAATHPQARAEVFWEGGQFTSARQDPGHPSVRRLVRCGTQVTGSEPRVLGTTYGSDLRLTVAAGIPSMLFGPGHFEQAHTVGESVAVADVVSAAQVILRWVLDED